MAIDTDRAMIRKRIREALTAMNRAEHEGKDNDMLVAALWVERDAKALREHAENHGL